MSDDNYSRITQGLRILQASLVPFVERELKGLLRERWWSEGVLRHLSEQQAADLAKDTPAGKKPTTEHLDVALLLAVIDSNWGDVFRVKLSRDVRTWLNELRSVRNKWAHAKKADVSPDDAWRALDTMARVLECLPAHPAMQEVRKLCAQVRQAEVEAMVARTPQPEAKTGVQTLPGAGPLLPWRDVATPHPDVAKGKYRQAEFAADLAQVLAGTATPEYQDPIEFFKRTYLTEGMTQTLTSAVERVTGKTGEPVVQLKTAFGGGKTHTMLALYHLLGARAPLETMQGIDEILKRTGAKKLPSCRCAILVGTALSPAKAREHRKLKQGRKVHTLWGEMAAQLGGDAAYDAFAEDDRKRTAPGSDDIAALLDKLGPCLILMDELVAYARQLYGADERDIAAGTFDANMTFVQNLTEGVKRSKASLLVASIPESDIEIGGTGGQAALERIENTFARVEAVWKPVAASEAFEIVRRRLFNPIVNVKARDEVCGAFSEMYRKHPSDFPAECREKAYLDRMKGAYPIHPEFFDRLYQDWSTLDRFQRTRGVLRLMASTIFQLWSQEDRSLMILPGSIPMYAPTVRDEVTRYLPEGWNAVVDSDIDGDRSVPYLVDKESARFGQFGAARRVARAVFLGSAPKVKEQHLRGIEDIRVRLGSVQAAEAIAVFNDALGTLRDRLTHLYEANRRYWYDQPPNLRRTVDDRAAAFDEANEVLPELEGRLKKNRERGEFAGVHVCVESGDIPDEQEVRLVVLPPTQGHRHGKADSKALAAAREILERRGAGSRQYKNMLVFVAPDEDLAKSLLQVTRQHLAWQSVNRDRKALNLDALQSEEAEKKVEETGSKVDLQINEVYCWLLLPTQDTPPGQDPGALRWEIIRIAGGNEGFVKKASRKTVSEGHVNVKWNPHELKTNLDRWLWQGAPHLGVKKLWDYLSTYTYLPRLRDSDVLLDTIKEGVRAKGFFGYAAAADGQGRYQGLKLGETAGAVYLDANSVVVAEAAAQAQLDADARQAEAKPGKHGDLVTNGSGGSYVTGPTPTPRPGSHPTPPSAAAQSRPKLHRFHAAVTLDPVRMARDFEKASQEVIQHLTKLGRSRVTVTLEIEAELPDGADEGTVRTITENCRTLKFRNYDFEE